MRYNVTVPVRLMGMVPGVEAPDAKSAIQEAINILDAEPTTSRHVDWSTADFGPPDQCSVEMMDPRADWQAAVHKGQTELGFREWLAGHFSGAEYGQTATADMVAGAWAWVLRLESALDDCNKQLSELAQAASPDRSSGGTR